MEEFTSFNEYLSYFNQQDSLNKKKIILEQLKMINKFTNAMCSSLDINSDLVTNLKNNINNDTDYYESLIILINSIQDSLCNFSDKFSDIMEYASNK